MNLDKAIELAIKYHQGQKDKGGNPYILHPLHVMNNVRTEKEKIVAILHDVIEDSTYTFEDLKKDEFSSDIIEALVFLTHDKNTDYFDYIKKIKRNKLARNVKLEDLKHNLDITRLKTLDDKTFLNLKKYWEAYKILKRR